MPDHPAPARAAERTPVLVVTGALAIMGLLIALLAATPSRVGATELLGAVRMPGDAAFIASHRGGGATAPENTIPAISAALADGFDYVEVDVALTLDREPVLLHDATVDRTTDGHGPVAELTLAQVRSLDAGRWFAPEFAGTRIPVFTEFADLLATTSQRAIVELKGEWDAAAVARIVADLEARSLERRVALASFDARTLAVAEQAGASVPRMLILRQMPDDVVAAAAEAGARGVIVSRTAVLARPEVVYAAHAAGVRLVVYTLNADEQWDEVTALGVDGIVTDDPGALSAWQEVASADG